MKRAAVSMTLLLLALGTGCASVGGGADRLDAELDRITRLWSGTYADAEYRHRIEPILAPRFGERVYFYQLERAEAGDKPLQQKVFSFRTDPQRERNRMHAWVLSPAQLDPGIADDPAKWLTLAPGELTDFPDACAFVWRATRGAYRGAVSADNCEFSSGAFGQRVRPDMSYTVSTDALVWDETLAGADGVVLASTDRPRRAVRVGPVIDVRRSFYGVRGDTAAEIRRALYAGTPNVVDGEQVPARTDWFVAWRVDTNETDAGCSVAAVATEIAIVHVLPQLVNRADLPGSLQEEWDAYLAGLLRQESGHRRFAVAAARRIESALPELGARASCDAVRQAAAGVADAVIDSARRRDRQYEYAIRQASAGFGAGA
jgi:predicted secreted Zn-dependent protease